MKFLTDEMPFPKYGILKVEELEEDEFYTEAKDIDHFFVTDEKIKNHLTENGLVVPPPPYMDDDWHGDVFYVCTFRMSWFRYAKVTYSTNPLIN